MQGRISVTRPAYALLVIWIRKQRASEHDHIGVAIAQGVFGNVGVAQLTHRDNGYGRPALERILSAAKRSRTARATGTKQPAGMLAGGWGIHQLS